MWQDVLADYKLGFCLNDRNSGYLTASVISGADVVVEKCVTAQGQSRRIERENREVDSAG